MLMDSLENDHVPYDDLLTPVIEEQERSCEDYETPCEKTFCEAIVGARRMNHVENIVDDDDKTPVNVVKGLHFIAEASRR